eukprot:364473-Chlamydomonas_euryale.AAC.9
MHAKVGRACRPVMTLQGSCRHARPHACTHTRTHTHACTCAEVGAHTPIELCPRSCMQAWMHAHKVRTSMRGCEHPYAMSGHACGGEAKQ